MIKPRELKPIKCGFGDEQIAFYPRMANKAERDAINAELAEAESDTVDKYKRIFEIKREAVAQFSTKMPCRIETVKGQVKLVPVAETGTPAEGMNSFFATSSAENEEVIDKTYDAFIALMSATASFL